MCNRYLLLLFLGLFIAIQANSQSLRSLKNKLENAIIDEAVDNMFDDKEEESKPSQTESSNSDRPSQKSGGEGLDNSLDDVPESLDKASEQFSANDYKNARTSLRKALRTLEYKIGGELLASLPEKVNGLSFKPDADELSATSSRWDGLTIHREYQDGDTWAAINIYNSSSGSIANAAVQASWYTVYDEEDESQKSIQVKGNDAVINFSDTEGYTISIALGQQSYILLEGVNVASESAMIAIAESFDYDHIKKTLGDQ